MKLTRKTKYVLCMLVMLCMLVAIYVLDTQDVMSYIGIATMSDSVESSAQSYETYHDAEFTDASGASESNEKGASKKLVSYNLMAKSDAQYARLLSLLAKMGIAPERILPQLKSVAITADCSAMERIFNEIGSFYWEEDCPVARPVEERMSSRMKPFGKSLLDWLKIDRNSESRGENVKLAIIDEPLTPTESTAKASIMQMDMFALSGQGDSFHGNSIASILVSNSDYLQGIVPGASILSIPVIGSDGTGSNFNLAAAIVKAVENGANIISISLCSDARSYVLENAVKYAKENGCVVVAAAGNDGSGKDVYPASFSDVISVSACDATGMVTNFSNYSSKVDICAPGVGIAVDDSEPDSDSLGYFTGTSAAVPCVAGVIACIMWENPGLSAAQAAELVLNKAVDEGASSKDKLYGSGLVSYQRASKWEDNDFTDVAATGHYFDLNDVHDESITLHLGAQNTGNTTLGSITLNYVVNDQNGSATFYDVAPGASVGTQVKVGLSEVENIKVSTKVETDAEEHNLDNNIKTRSYELIKQ